MHFWDFVIFGHPDAQIVYSHVGSSCKAEFCTSGVSPCCDTTVRICPSELKQTMNLGSEKDQWESWHSPASAARASANTLHACRSTTLVWESVCILIWPHLTLPFSVWYAEKTQEMTLKELIEGAFNPIRIRGLLEVPSK